MKEAMEASGGGALGEVRERMAGRILDTKKVSSLSLDCNKGQKAVFSEI